MKLNALHTIYFLGIGGIGMSAIARYFHQNGVHVSGYDKTETPLTKALCQEGISVHYHEDIALIPSSVDLIVYTPAIPKDNKEYQYILEKKYTLKKRSEVLGLITQDKFTIAIAGTHGKTSVTSLVAHILHHSGKKIDAFIGGVTKNYQSNLILTPDSEVVVVEADEYDRSFLTLNPDIAIITSMDADHLDIYGHKEELVHSFHQFMGKITTKGTLIAHHSLLIPEEYHAITHPYGADKGEVSIANSRMVNHHLLFDIQGAFSMADISFQLPGKHNMENALAASYAAYIAGVSPVQIKEALGCYTGVMRRFDYRVRQANMVYIDDYAHHPEELRACISAVRQLYPNKKITGLFQPHLFTRTRDFADDFGVSLSLLDELILLDIYPARELPIEGVTSQMLWDKVTLSEDKKWLMSKEAVLPWIENHAMEVVLTLGAGDIDTLVIPLTEMLKNR